MYQQVELTIGREHVVSREHKFEHALEEQTAALRFTELLKNNVKSQNPGLLDEHRTWRSGEVLSVQRGQLRQIAHPEDGTCVLVPTAVVTESGRSVPRV